jgi:serine/threonine protein kinase
VEPSVPPELAAIIERALRKDPAQRFQDLAQMRDQLQRVLRALERNRDQARNRVRGKLAEVGALQAAVLALLGTPADEDTIPMVDDRMGLAQLVDLD